MYSIAKRARPLADIYANGSYLATEGKKLGEYYSGMQVKSSLRGILLRNPNREGLCVNV
jgi:hypothetical protein